ncbi:T9SS type A sorting domain-containing protein [bacterium SCSIO 12643]|nr:T9SS type A sorting domain-containing protein [bacterium SCSIO 12643]
MVRKLLILMVLVPFFGWAQNQEVATFVSYNTLNYRNETSFCTNTNNSPLAKEGYMKTIFAHVQPDLIACNEVGSNPSNASKILDRCLNVNGETKYEMAPFNYSSGSSIANAFFYNGEMFALKSNDQIRKEVGGDNIIRLIDVFELYYKDANLSLGADTTFLTVFVAHLKAGSGSSNENQRDEATQAVMKYITDENINGNYIFSGDFNVYAASEAAFQNLVNPSNPQVKFIDPVNRMGSWNNNGAYADVHTQSTRSVGNGCASGGGLDDRFDFVLISQDIKDNGNRIEYVSNSYKALANDGNHFNSAINNPSNNSVPANVLDAIYNGSDHLPVVMDMIITEAQPNSVAESVQSDWAIQMISPGDRVSGKLVGPSGNYTIKIYSITGALLKHQDIVHQGETTFEYSDMPKGVLLVKVEDNSGNKKVVRVIQN